MAKTEGPALAETLVRRLEALGKTAVLAESCTAGLAADLIASVPGASGVLWGSFVTYTVAAKIRMLGLEEALLSRYGAVSRETACAMAAGALEKSGAAYSLSITGLAGPGGDGSGVPVGTVWIGCARHGEEAEAEVFHFTGSRNEVRREAAEKAVLKLLEYLDMAGKIYYDS
ncbi:MAG: CinA family protein [Treponema sp.]|jgi:PncC family amidohydrolase|nr:CinA family protein [Treponema sp.]